MCHAHLNTACSLKSELQLVSVQSSREAGRYRMHPLSTNVICQRYHLLVELTRQQADRGVQECIYAGCMQPFVLRQWLHKLGRRRREAVLAEVMGLLQSGVIRPFSGAPGAAMLCGGAIITQFGARTAGSYTMHALGSSFIIRLHVLQARPSSWRR